MIPVDYKKVEFELHELLVKIEKAYTLLAFDDDLLMKIRECMDLIKTKRYTIAVVGEFKRGKSSLINALLGSKILPADVTPTTATINRITFSPVPKTIINYKDGTSEEININDLCDYVTKLSEDGKNRISKIKEATIFYPAQICQNHIDIIDTPGLNDEEQMTKITINMLPDIDAAIVPIHARMPFSETEKSFVCRLLESNNIQNIIFVMTFMDQLDEDDYEYNSFINSITERIRNEIFTELKNRSSEEHVMNKARSVLDNMKLHTISSTLALKSFVTNNRKDLTKSGFEEFHKNLIQIITAKQIENAVLKCVREIRTLLSVTESQNIKKSESINFEIKQLEQLLQTISEYRINAKKKLDDIFSAGYLRIEEAINDLYDYKNKATSLFINSLSEVKIRDSKNIQDALKKANIECYELINNIALPEIKQTVLKYLSDDINEFMICRKTLIDNMSSVIGEPQPDDIFGSMHDIAENTLLNQSFEWTHSSIPRIHDLSNVNVIKNAINAIDLSVNDCITEFKSAINEIQKKWFITVNDDIKKITVYIDNESNVKHDDINTKLKVQNHNYTTLQTDFNEILERCEAVMTEVLPDFNSIKNI